MKKLYQNWRILLSHFGLKEKKFLKRSSEIGWPPLKPPSLTPYVWNRVTGSKISQFSHNWRILLCRFGSKEFFCWNEGHKWVGQPRNPPFWPPTCETGSKIAQFNLEKVVPQLKNSTWPLGFKEENILKWSSEIGWPPLKPPSLAPYVWNRVTGSKITQFSHNWRILLCRFGSKEIFLLKWRS